MRYVHRMPLALRRFFTTSLTSGSRAGARDSNASKSAFVARFGHPNEQPSQTQTSFPLWPNALPTRQISSRPDDYVNRGSSPDLLTPLDKEEEQSGPSSQPPGQEQKLELFSDVLGNMHELLTTSSFQAKLAVQPAMEAYQLRLLAVKNNMHRFESLPPPVKHNFGFQNEPERHEAGSQGAESFSFPEAAQPSKANSRGTRGPPTSPSGYRMLSTFSVEKPLSCAPPAIMPITAATARRTSVLPLLSQVPPLDNLSWRECLEWVLDSNTNHRSRSPFSGSSISRRVYSIPQHFMYSNRVLSLFHPDIYASPVTSRGYATRCPSKSRTPQASGPPSKAPSSSSPLSPEDPYAPYSLVPAPSSRTELCSAMRYLIQSNNPRIQVARLMATHSQYPSLQTATSFNLLLAYSTRVAPLYFYSIVGQMRASDIAWNTTTQKLAVRAHIQGGRWKEAIELAERTWLPEGKSGPSTAPLDVFTELVHLALTPDSRRDDVEEMMKRCWKLLSAHPYSNASPKLAYNVVRLLVNQGHSDQAVELTKRWLMVHRSVKQLDIRFCLATIGLVVRPPERSARRPGQHPPLVFCERLTLFESLLTHNPVLKLEPDAPLTRCLLENLHRSRDRSTRAFHKLCELRAKYGPGVEDSAVRRLIARYAKHEGNYALARTMHEREELARTEPTQTLLTNTTTANEEQSPTGSEELSGTSSEEPGTTRSELDAPWVGAKPRVRLKSHREYIRSAGTDNVKWSLLSRNLRRAESKRRLTDPENLRLGKGSSTRGKGRYSKMSKKKMKRVADARKMKKV